MSERREAEALGELFRNAEIRRDAISAATGSTRTETPAKPAWQRFLESWERTVMAWPWRRIGQACGLVILVVVSGLVWHHRVWLNDRLTTAIAEATGATVQKIEVTGLRFTPHPALLEALGLGRGSSLVGFDAAAARSRIEALPWVRLASVERQLPATVKVQIFEYSPMARAISGSDVVVLNTFGKPVVTDTSNAFVALPLLQGAGAPAAAAALFALLQPHANLMTQLREALWVGERRWDLRFMSGVTVMLPEGREAEAIALLNRLEAARHVLTLNDGVVDLRLPDRIILRLPPTVTATPVTNKVGSTNSPTSITPPSTP